MNRLEIRKIGYLSVAKLYALLSFFVGLIIGIPYGLLIIFFGLSIAGVSGKNATTAGFSSVAIGIIAMIFFPILYAIFGFISGIILALLYNLCASLVGGVEIEVETIR